MSIPDSFYALCVQKGDQTQVRKFTFNNSKNKKSEGPWFTLPESYWEINKHEEIKKAINLNDLNDGGYRTVCVKLVNGKSKVPTSAAVKYLNKNCEFKIDDKLLQKEVADGQAVGGECDLTVDLTVEQIMSAFSK